MTNLTPKSQFDDVYQLERNDPALAGPGGVLNKPLQDLTNRTEYLKDNKADKSEIVKGQYSFTTLAKFNEKKATIPADSTVIIEEAGANQGTNTWDGTTLTKSVYDPLAQAKADATAKAETAKNDAITAAATDASIKATAAESNAKLAAQNTDVKLLTSIQQIIDAITQFRNDYDFDLAALSALINSNDAQANTRIARLLVAFQQVVLTISDNRDELDILIAANTASINTNNTAIATLQNSSANYAVENLLINSRITRLLVSIQQIVQTFSENRDEIDVLITALNGTANNNIEISNRLNQSLQLVVHAVTQLNTDFNDSVMTEAQKLANLLSQQRQLVELAKLDGFDPNNAGANKYIESENIVFFPAPESVIRIDVDVEGNLPSAKGTVLNVITAINVDGQILKNFGTLEVQGSSSAAFPKKNWTLCLFSDEARTSAIKIKLGNMIVQEELVFKANFVDNTHTRNIAVNRLYDQMQMSRVGFPKREVDFVNMLNPDLTVENYNGLKYAPTGATGHVDGYPSVIYINSFFYGIGTLNIGKKRDNYNLDKNNQKHIQLEPLGGVDFYNATLEEFEIRRPSSWKAEAQTAYERFIAFLQMSQADMQTAGIDNYINRAQMQDFIILSQLCDLWDHLYKNTLYTTWDGLVWSFMPYDLDTVFGLHFTGIYFDPSTGAALHPATTLRIPNNGGSGNWPTVAKFRLIYGADLDARYAALRKAKIIDLDNIVNLCESVLRKFPTALLEAENTKWNTGSTSIYSSLQQTGSIHQIRTWLATRLPLVDAYFNYTNS